jgi:NadR type nicotinamide-nucleotide adenylyltransferase
MRIKKIVIIGPESTGKSMLSENLALHFNTVWAKEYAREYLEKHGTNYSFEDLYTIAQGQLKNEEEAYAEASRQQNSPYCFIDTDMQVIRVWSEFVFNKCDNRVLKTIVERKYDGYILSNVDLPWVKDKLREYPDLATREKLFFFYKEILTEQKTPWTIIYGDYAARTKKAIDFVASL